jgi:hypothetical protein
VGKHCEETSFQFYKEILKTTNTAGSKEALLGLVILYNHLYILQNRVRYRCLEHCLLYIRQARHAPSMVPGIHCNLNT